ncbi:MAG: hypothetical protein QUS11_09585 [Candidatus Fermentibacter sp.]|nr:hypothetical protein [Candidatus Fermentibacter sp.]
MIFTSLSVAAIPLLILFTGCGSDSPSGPDWTGDVGYAGVRSSSYGADPYPDPAGWQDYVEAMSDAFPGSTPCALWIVGTVDEGIEGINLEFPSDGGTYPHVSFTEEDLHEEYLDWFDQCGIRVFLQVEPGFADVDTLIALVMDRYGDHPCVAGFGVDVEWYGNVTEGGEGTPVDDSSAEAWETHLQSYGSGLGLFLKHWDPAFMPPSYRGNLIFVDDGQGYGDMDGYLADMAAWAEEFVPNRVFFQYGYEADRVWWDELESPPADIGAALAAQTSQECGLIWVDFNLAELDP